MPIPCPEERQAAVESWHQAPGTRHQAPGTTVAALTARVVAHAEPKCLVRLTIRHYAHSPMSGPCWMTVSVAGTIGRVEPTQEVAVVRWIAFACVMCIGYFVSEIVFGALYLVGFSIPKAFGIWTSMAIGVMAAVSYSRRQRRRAYSRANAA